MAAPIRVVAAILLVLTVLPACSGNVSEVLRHSEEGRLTIGITQDQPGLGLRRADGSLRGFDVDVARYVADALGAENISWANVALGDRENAIESGAVDMVVASYSITEERKKRVSFAGPYFVAGQDLLVRMNDTVITGPEALDGRRLCSVTGTTSAKKIRADFSRAVQLVEYDRFSVCVTALLAGQVDAVTTDNLILAGYVEQNPELLRIVGKTFTDEQYGIGLPLGDAQARSAVNSALEKMISAGAWKAALQRNFGEAGLTATTPVINQ